MHLKTASQSPGELLTTEQVMDRLIADANLRRLASLCVLPAVRHGNEWRFRKSDLDDWIADQLTGGPQKSSRI